MHPLKKAAFAVYIFPISFLGSGADFFVLVWVVPLNLKNSRLSSLAAIACLLVFLASSDFNLLRGMISFARILLQRLEISQGPFSRGDHFAATPCRLL